jgi:hypothetical protein
VVSHEEAIHLWHCDSPELGKLLSINGSLVAEAHHLIYAARKLYTHVLWDPIDRPKKFQRRGEHIHRLAISGDITREKLLHWLVDPKQWIMEMGVCREVLIEPGVEFELDHLTEPDGERVVVR